MKRSFRSLSKAVPLFVVAISVSGCVPMIVMHSMDRQHYSDYVVKTEQINLERQKDGLQPVQVMTFKQWHGNQMF